MVSGVLVVAPVEEVAQVGVFRVLAGKRAGFREEYLKLAVEKTLKAIGDNVVTIALYGSYGTKDYLPGISDVNLLIVSKKEPDLANIAGLSEELKSLGFAIPLILKKEFIDTSLDIFPLEYLKMMSQYQVLYGKDLFKDLVISKTHLRLQCEREAKSKYLVLRQAYLESFNNKKRLKLLLLASLKALSAILWGINYLMGNDRPEDTRALIGLVLGPLGIGLSPVSMVLDLREGKIRPNLNELRELYISYVGVFGELASALDKWEV